MKIVKSVAAAAAIFVTAAGIASAADWPADMKKPVGQMTIGFSQLGSNVATYVTSYVNAFNKFAKDWDVKVVVLDAQNDPAKQATDVRDLISQKVDAIIVWPANPKAIVPVLKEAKEKNIPVIVTNSAADAEADKYIVAFTGPDQYVEGVQGGELMAEALNGKGNVVMIMGGAGFAGTVQREQGFRDAVAKFPGIKILDRQYADWNREKAQSTTENFITRFADQLDGIYTMDSGMGIGVLEGYRAAKANGSWPAGKDLKLVDSTLFTEIYDAIGTGEYYGSVLQLATPDAELALKTAVLAAGGVPVKTSYYETKKVTKANIAQMPRPDF